MIGGEMVGQDMNGGMKVVVRRIGQNHFIKIRI